VKEARNKSNAATSGNTEAAGDAEAVAQFDFDMIKDYCFPAFKNAFFNSFKKKMLFSGFTTSLQKTKKTSKIAKN